MTTKSVNFFTPRGWGESSVERYGKFGFMDIRSHYQKSLETSNCGEKKTKLPDKKNISNNVDNNVLTELSIYPTKKNKIPDMTLSDLECEISKLENSISINNKRSNENKLKLIEIKKRLDVIMRVQLGSYKEKQRVRSVNIPTRSYRVDSERKMRVELQLKVNKLLELSHLGC